MRRYAGALRHGIKKWQEGSLRHREEGRSVGLLWRGIFLVLAVLFFAEGSLCAGSALPFSGNIILVCGEQGITGAQAALIREAEEDKENGKTFTVWSERRQVRICDVDGYRSVSTNVMEINGTSELLFPYGGILHEEDVTGCLLGEKTAENLFGSRNAVGLTLCYGERELTVRGILSTPEDLLVVEMTGKADCFDRIAVNVQPGEARKLTGERMLSYGLDAEMLRYDLFSGERLIELIPGKWSDFSGWRDNIGKFGEDFCRLLSAEKSSVELVCMERAGKAAVCILLGAAAFTKAFWGKRRGKKKM